MRLRFSWIGTAAVTALLISAAPASAGQTEVQLRLDPTPDWEIRISLGAAVGGDWLDGGRVERLDSRRLVLVPSLPADHFVVASIDGSAWERVGRSGEGPGEYQHIMSIVPRGSALHVFDAIAMRRTVLNERFEVVHTSPLGVQMAFNAPAVLDDSTYVANGSIPTPARVGYVLHHFDASGDVIRSFDENPYGHGTGDAEMALNRTLLVGADGMLWSSHRTQYRIDAWDVGRGRRTRSLVREADWFVPHAGWVIADPDNPPHPSVVDMEADDEGRLLELQALPNGAGGQDCD